MDFRNIRAISLRPTLSPAQSCTSSGSPEGRTASPSVRDFAPAFDYESTARARLVERDALDALRDMSEFLLNARTMEIQVDGRLDAVTETGRPIRYTGVTAYKIRRPGFVLDPKSEARARHFIHDGRTLTIYSPGMGLHAMVPASPTNREVLNAAYDKFGVTLSLEDLFRWNDAAASNRLRRFEAAYEIGRASLDGVATDHFAFREASADWQIWIDQGPRPFPRKLVISDRRDPAKPTFIARLKWKLNPTFTASDFAFLPGADDGRIALAAFGGRGD